MEWVCMNDSLQQRMTRLFRVLFVDYRLNFVIENLPVTELPEDHRKHHNRYKSD